MNRSTIVPMTQNRVLICSDAKNEADDQYAIVQALLTTKFDIVGMVAQFYGENGSTEKSYQEMVHLAELVGCDGSFPIIRGALGPLEQSELQQLNSGSEFILEELCRQDKRPLYILCLGPLTDLAAALYNFNHQITNVTVIWVGGGRYPKGSPEANLQRDLLAANLIMASDIPIWQIPSNVYKTMLVSVAELEIKVAPYGDLGRYLYQQLIDFANDNIKSKYWINSEAWVLGDSTAVGVLLAEQKGNYHEQIAPYFHSDGEYDLTQNSSKRLIRVYDQIDTRFILEDLFAKIQLLSTKISGF